MLYCLYTCICTERERERWKFHSQEETGSPFYLDRHGDGFVYASLEMVTGLEGNCPACKGKRNVSW